MPGWRGLVKRVHLPTAVVSLFAATLVFTASMGVALYNLRLYEQLGRIELTDATWLVSEMRHELLRFRRSLDLYPFPRSEVDGEELTLRYDLLLSRLPFFLEGEESARFRQMPGLQQTIRQAQADLLALEESFATLEKGDFEGYEAIRERLAPIVTALDGLVLRVMMTEEGAASYRNERLEDSYSQLLVAFAGALVTGALLIGLLIAEIRKTRAAEKRVTSAGQRLREAIDNVSDGFVLYDHEGRLELWNDRLIDLSGSIGRFVGHGKHFREVLEDAAAAGCLPAGVEDATAWIEDQCRCFAKPSSEFEEQLDDGRWVLVRRQRMPSGRTAAIRAEITAIKVRETALARAKRDAEQASRAKSVFLATVSHELRTPLNAIIGFSELLDREIHGPLGTESYKGYVSDIHNSGQHLLAVINDILDLSRIEAGRVELAEEAINAGALAHEIVRLLRGQAEAAGLALEVKVPSVPPVVIGDPRMLRQVLINLVGNAIKFTPSGGRVQIWIDRDEAGDPRITVSDTGLGVSADDLPHLTEPFWQGGETLSRRQQGTGLGLSLVKAIVEAHKGRLEIESEPRRGTNARVLLPGQRLSDFRARDAS